MTEVRVRDPKTGTMLAALVDDDDWPLVAGRCWTLNRTGYAMGNIQHASLRRRRDNTLRSVRYAMHRIILGLPMGDPREEDHRNGNRLDNRRENLRIVVDGEQQQNRRPNRPRVMSTLPQSRFRGVHWDAKSQKWRASVRKRTIGRFND